MERFIAQSKEMLERQAAGPSGHKYGVSATSTQDSLERPAKEAPGVRGTRLPLPRDVNLRIGRSAGAPFAKDQPRLRSHLDQYGECIQRPKRIGKSCYSVPLSSLGRRTGKGRNYSSIVAKGKSRLWRPITFAGFFQAVAPRAKLEADYHTIVFAMATLSSRRAENRGRRLAQLKHVQPASRFRLRSNLRGGHHRNVIPAEMALAPVSASAYARSERNGRSARTGRASGTLNRRLAGKNEEGGESKHGSKFRMSAFAWRSTRPKSASSNGPLRPATSITARACGRFSDTSTRACRPRWTPGSR